MLRVGVILESALVPAWVADTLKRISDSGDVGLSLVIYRDAKRDENRERTSALFNFWEKLDRSVYKKKSKRRDANEMVPIAFTAETPTIAQGDEWGDAERNALKADLDVVINFTDSRSVSSEMKEFARFGCWSVSSIPAEVVFDRMGRPQPFQETGFEVYRADESMYVRCARFISFQKSLYLNREHVCWRTADGVIRCLEGVERSGWSYLDSRRVASESSAKGLPDNVRMISFLLHLGVRAVLDRMRRTLFCEDWFIAYGRCAKWTEGRSPKIDLTVVRAPRNRFFADPFVVEKNERTFVFFEDYERENRKAVISFVELRNDGSYSKPEAVLERNYHLSYPCVFEWRGEMYMIPESVANRTIELYHATDFPRGWQLERVLLENVSCVDSTIVEHNGRFWLFTAGAPKPTPEFTKTDDELLLFFADTPLGPWTAHPMNPIVCDARSCRPAGRLFIADGALIRPSQDCSVSYGRAVALNRVETLTKTEYREVPIATIGPDWLTGNLGTHTYDRSETYQVVDGRTWAGARWTLRPRGGHMQRVVSEREFVRFDSSSKRAQLQLKAS